MSWIVHSLSWLSMPCKQLIRMIWARTKNIILLVISRTALGHFMSYFVDFGSRTLRSRHHSSAEVEHLRHTIWDFRRVTLFSFFHSFITEEKGESYRNCDNEFQKLFSSSVCPGADDPEEINPGDSAHSYKFVKTAYSNCTHVIGSVVLINLAGGASLVSSFFFIWFLYEIFISMRKVGFDQFHSESPNWGTFAIFY